MPSIGGSCGITVPDTSVAASLAAAAVSGMTAVALNAIASIAAIGRAAPSLPWLTTGLCLPGV